jgi:putative nucleotidyltransferase with HDIG domain
MQIPIRRDVLPVRVKLEGALKRVRHLQLSLLAKFSIVSFVLLAAIGGVMAWTIQMRLEDIALRQEAENAADEVATVLNPNLAPADLAGTLAPERYARISALIQNTIVSQHIVRVKIWNRGGRLIYSDEEGLVGQQFPVSAELEAALSGEVAMQVSGLQKAENVGERSAYARLLEVYVPLRPMNSTQVLGAYEIYHDLTTLEPRIAEIQRQVWLSVMVGFLVLYVSLFTLVRSASRELVRRNAENARLYEQEQTRRAELAALYQLSRNLADVVRDFDAVLDLVLRRAVTICHVAFARIALVEDDTFVLRSAHPVRVLNSDLGVGCRIALAAHPFVKAALAQDTPAILSSDTSEINDEERQFLFLGIANTVCLVPLRTGGRALGLLMLGEVRRRERELFTPDKVRLARSIGDQAASALRRVELLEELERSYLQTVIALGNAVEAKDNYTSDHAQRLAQMAIAVAQELGMPQHDFQALRYGAILHDIGKIGVPDAILQKPSKLDADEWKIMRQHPEIGAHILAPIPHLSHAAEIVRHHHERYDGRGYPDGLVGEAIPLGARILTVVDSYSAIMDKRAYKEARSHVEAMAELQKHAGTQFDPRVVEVFLGLLKRGLDADATKEA